MYSHVVVIPRSFQTTSSQLHFLWQPCTYGLKLSTKIQSKTSTQFVCKVRLTSNICTWLYCLFQLDTYEELMEVSAVEFSACGLFPVNVEQGLNVRHVSSPLTSNKSLRFIVMRKQWFSNWLIYGPVRTQGHEVFALFAVKGITLFKLVKLVDKLIWQIDRPPTPRSYVISLRFDLHTAIMKTSY